MNMRYRGNSSFQDINSPIRISPNDPLDKIAQTSDRNFISVWNMFETIRAKENVSIRRKKDGTVILSDGNQTIELPPQKDIPPQVSPQVQSNWAETDASNISFIQNKPTIYPPIKYTVGDGGLTEKNFTISLFNKLNGIEDGAGVNVQSDWNVTNTSDDAFIKNKPTITPSLWEMSGTDTVKPLSNISFVDIKSGLKSTLVTTAIPFGETGHISLSNFTATSIIGALDELKEGTSLWQTDNTTLSPLGAETGISVSSSVLVGATLATGVEITPTGINQFDNNLIRKVGDNNIFMGRRSGNDTLTTASNNFAYGAYTLLSITTGEKNYAIMENALKSITTGNKNFAIGTFSGQGIEESSYGIFFGSSAGRTSVGWQYVTSAEKSLFLGYNTRASATVVELENVIGATAYGHGNNTTTIGGDANIGNYLTGALYLKEQSEPSAVTGWGGFYVNSSDSLPWYKSDDGSVIPLHMRAGVVGGTTAQVNGIAFDSTYFDYQTNATTGVVDISAQDSIKNLWEENNTNKTIEPKSDFAIQTTQNSNGSGGFVKLCSASSATMSPLVYGLSESSDVGNYYYAKPTSTTQTGFVKAAHYFNAIKNDGTALTSGKLISANNAGVEKFSVDYTGNTKNTGTLYIKEQSEPSAVTGWGGFYVNSSDSLPWYKSDDGSVIPLHMRAGLIGSSSVQTNGLLFNSSHFQNMTNANHEVEVNLSTSFLDGRRLWEENSTNKTIEPKSDFAIQTTQNSNGGGGLVKLGSASSVTMIPLMYGLSESVDYGNCYHTIPTSPTQTGFTKAAHYFNTVKNDNTALTSGKLISVNNAGVERVSVDFDGNTKIRSSLYVYNTDTATTGVKLMTGT